MDARPAHALVGLGQLDLPKLRLHGFLDEAAFIESGAGFDGLRFHFLTTERDLQKGIRSEQIPAAAQQRVYRVRGRLGGLPIRHLLLLDQPDLAVINRLGIGIDVAESLDHHRLRLDRRLPPPPAFAFDVLPEHPLLFGDHRMFLQRAGDQGRHFLVAEAMQRERDMGAGHPAAERGPVLARLAGEVVEGDLAAGIERLVLEEEGPQVELERDRLVEVLLVAVLRTDVLVALGHRGIERSQRFQSRGDVGFHAQRPQAREAGGDVARDVGVAATAGEPRPQAIATLHGGQFGERLLQLAVHVVVIEKQADAAARFRLAGRLTQPRRLFQHDAVDVGVLGQRTVERLPGRLPLIEDLAHLRIGFRDVPGEGVGVVAVEGLLRALVGELHQVRQRHHRVPCRLRDDLDVKEAAFQGLRSAAGEQLVEGEILYARVADRQRHRLRDEDPPRDHRQPAFLSVAERAARGDRLVFEEAPAVRHRDPPLQRATFLGRHREILVRRRDPHRGGLVRIGRGIREGEPRLAGLFLVAGVGDFHREPHRVALAQEARWVRLHHQVLRGDRLTLQQAGAELRVVRHAEEAPLCQRLRHGEGHPHLAIGIAGQVGEEERGLLQIRPRGDLRHVHRRCSGFASLLGVVEDRVDRVAVDRAVAGAETGGDDVACRHGGRGRSEFTEQEAVRWNPRVETECPARKECGTPSSAEHSATTAIAPLPEDLQLPAIVPEGIPQIKSLNVWKRRSLLEADPLAAVFPHAEIGMLMPQHARQCREGMRREGVQRSIVKCGHHLGDRGFPARVLDHRGPGFLRAGLEL